MFRAPLPLHPGDQFIGNGADGSPFSLGLAVARQHCLDDPVHDVCLGDHVPDGARLIQLGGRLGAGRFAVVDEADYDFLVQFAWSARVMASGLVYAKRVGRRGEPATVYMHRDILRPPAGLFTDHANGCGLDNRRANLRACTRGQNAVNQSPSRALPKGVHARRSGKRFFATITCNGIEHYLGQFRTTEEAARAYDTAAKQFFGPFARLNFPDDSTVSHATDDDCGRAEWRGGGRLRK